MAGDDWSGKWASVLALGLVLAMACGGHTERTSDEAESGTGGVARGGSAGSPPYAGDEGGSSPFTSGGKTFGDGGSGVTSATGGAAQGGDGTIGGSGGGITCVESEEVTITTEAELEAFAARGCEVLDGSLAISPFELVNLNGLTPSTLRKITGSLAIANTFYLEDIEGLGGLQEVGGTVTIAYNDALLDLGGLESLVSVGGDPSSDALIVASNASLTSLAALAKAALAVNLTVTDNPQLQDLTGLEGLVDTTSVTITASPGLKSVSGLDNLSSCNSLSVSANDALMDVTLPALSTADYLLITTHPLLLAISVPNLLTVKGGLTVASNDVLTSLNLDALTNVGALYIAGNPQYPQCEVDALASRLNVTCSCGGNDATAVCN